MHSLTHVCAAFRFFVMGTGSAKKLGATEFAGHGRAAPSLLTLILMKLSWIFVILLLVVVAIFSVQNADAVTVRFLRWEITMSAALVIQIAALLGGLVGLAVGVRSGRISRKERSESVRTVPADRNSPALTERPAFSPRSGAEGTRPDLGPRP